MKVLFLALGNAQVPSSRTRVYQYLPYFRQAGVRISVIQYQTGLDFILWSKLFGRIEPRHFLFKLLVHLIALIDGIYSRTQLMKFLFKAYFADVVVVQKVLLSNWAQSLLFFINPKLVYDCDDAIYLGTARGKSKQLENQLSLMKLVVVENEAMENYVQRLGPPTIRITGPIDCNRYQPPLNRKVKKEIIIGWVGSSGTVRYLNSIRIPLMTIAKNSPSVVLHVIGGGKFQMEGIQIKNIEWELATEVENLSQFDFGIMPLTDDEFSRGKGGYKLLQYMAMGIPSIGSPVGINKEIIDHGKTGYLASTTSEWIEALETLIHDSDLRFRMGKLARERAKNNYSFEKSTPLFLRYLKQINAQPDQGNNKH